MKRANLLARAICETIFSARQGVYPVAAKKLAPYGRVDYSTRMDGADWAIRLTAFAAFAGYLGALAKWPKRRQPTAWPSALCLWSLGLIAFLAHFVCAFHFEYKWSHDQALAATAQQTAEVTGTDTGIGLYFNYAFMLVWLVDCVWWHLAKPSHETRPAWLGVGIHGFMLFMWFNATVVFGTPLGQALGWTAFTGLAAWQFYSKRRANAPLQT